VALARALVYSPSILLLDEPLSNLDAKLRGQMRIELKRLQERVSVTVLFVTHDQIEAMSLSTKLAVMRAGHIEQMGSPREVYEHPATPYVEDFLGRVLRFRGHVVERSRESVTVEIQETQGARLRAETADEGLKPGDKVLIAIRPEDLDLHKTGEGPETNTLRCGVEKVLYLGGEAELVLRFGDTPYTLVVSRAVLDRVANDVEVHLPAEHVRVWADSPSLGVVSALDEDLQVAPTGVPAAAAAGTRA
jgi:ABC-type Fe3+/spermidine/putrescine transport system ATPase subunit